VVPSIPPVAGDEPFGVPSPSVLVDFDEPLGAQSAWDSKTEPGVQLSEQNPGVGAAMDMVAGDQRAPVPSAMAARVAEEVDTLLRGAKDMLELDDHSGALDLILQAQRLAPDDPAVQVMIDRSERTLQAMFESKLGRLEDVPQVAIKEDEIIWLNLDHRAGFILAQIDGAVSYEDLFEVSGMSRLDTARILAQLIDEGVIKTR
jgi:hypothetical protein